MINHNKLENNEKEFYLRISLYDIVSINGKL